MKPSGGAFAILWMAGAACLMPGAAARGGVLELCGWNKCPPPYVHCMERPPCLKYKCVCPRPVCCPDQIENWGYFQTCWQPWPWPPSCAHCPSYAPPPGVQPPPVATAPTGRAMPPAMDSGLPLPRRVEDGQVPGQ